MVFDLMDIGEGVGFACPLWEIEKIIYETTKVKKISRIRREDPSVNQEC